MSVLKEMVADGILVVTLDRPEKLNALDVPSKERLGAIWSEGAADPKVRVVILRGAGERAFCAGSDIKEIQRTGTMVSTDTLLRAIPGVGIDFHKPVIAALHGFTIGFGLTLAIHCDFRFAAPATRFGFPEVQHGMISGVSAVTLPGLVGEPVALDLMLSGRTIEASEALAYGLIHRIADTPYDAALSFAHQLASNSPKAVALTKQLVLSDRRRRIETFTADIEWARSEVTTSTEYGEVVRRRPGTGRMRC
jgi:enoyl-CoA hydratase/carnithine racemase